MVMYRFIILCFTIGFAASAEENTEIAPVEFYPGLLCSVALIITPIAATVFALIRCLLKNGADGVLDCLWNDSEAALISYALISTAFCILDPPA